MKQLIEVDVSLADVPEISYVKELLMPTESASLERKQLNLTILTARLSGAPSSNQNPKTFIRHITLQKLIKCAATRRPTPESFHVLTEREMWVSGNWKAFIYERVWISISQSIARHGDVKFSQV